ncbi:putative DNA-directed RNA polymerase large subunit [Klebsormidium nitens]|uniref:DNA-directed RNA polymerase subunit n=1 Tax=Klebsormidium nitens TaxID=105231 RepID=A0A1Y1INF5_KLENI|nr:putative DNA-directed RNA polymerase large subunit [Klebsormidium nitens]|eukprot:GAQ89648.1 putative DNA-directed RNA polymerase large subunit [Klebsormidium nitens]
MKAPKAPLEVPESLCFQILGPEEIEKHSVARFDAKSELEPTKKARCKAKYAKLGVPYNAIGKCPTCGAYGRKCPGHFGHTDLAGPLFRGEEENKIIADVMRHLCFACGRPSRMKTRLAKIQDLQENKCLNPMDRRSMTEIAGNIRGPSVSATHPVLAQAGGLVLKGATRGILLRNWSQILCESCGASFKKLATTHPEMAIPRGFSALAILDALKRISDDDWARCPLRNSGRISVARPEWLLLTKLPIPPPHLCLTIAPLKKLVAKNRCLKREHAAAMRRDPDRALKLLAHRLPSELQPLANEHFGTKGTVSADVMEQVNALVGRSDGTGEERTPERKADAERNEGSGWVPRPDGEEGPGWGSGSNWDENKEQETEPEPERKPEHERKEKSAERKPAIKRRFFRKGKPLMLVPGATLKVGDTLERSLRNGDRVVINRYPSLHKGSGFSVTVRVSETKTFALHPAMCRGMGADFDGDTIVIHVPQAPEPSADVQSLLPIEENLVSPSGGEAMVTFLQDSLLALSEMVSTLTTFFTQEEAQNHFANVLLASGSEDGLTLNHFPEPAIWKHPGSEVLAGGKRVKNPVWTGPQLVAALLPDGFEYESPGDGLALIGGEFVEIDREGQLMVSVGRPVRGSAWLQPGPRGLVAALDQMSKENAFTPTTGPVCGPRGAAAALDALLALAHSVMDERGFSVGLADVTFADALKADVRWELFEAFQRETRGAAARAMAVRPKQVLGAFGKGRSREDENCAPGLMLASQSSAKAVQTIFKDYSSRLARLLLPVLPPTNAFKRMLDAGSKGSPSDLVQLCLAVGLQGHLGSGAFPLAVRQELYGAHFFSEDEFGSRLSADDAAARDAKARNCSLDQYREAAEPRARLQLLYAQANLGLVPVGFGGAVLARAREQEPMSDALRACGFWCTAQAGRDRNIAHHLLTALPHGIGSGLRAQMADVKLAYDGTCRDLSGTILYFNKEAEGPNDVDATRGALQLDPEESAGSLASYALSEPMSQQALKSKHPGQYAGETLDALELALQLKTPGSKFCHVILPFVPEVKTGEEGAATPEITSAREITSRDPATRKCHALMDKIRHVTLKDIAAAWEIRYDPKTAQRAYDQRSNFILSIELTKQAIFDHHLFDAVRTLDLPRVLGDAQPGFRARVWTEVTCHKPEGGAECPACAQMAADLAAEARLAARAENSSVDGSGYEEDPPSVFDSTARKLRGMSRQALREYAAVRGTPEVISGSCSSASLITRIIDCCKIHSEAFFIENHQVHLLAVLADHEIDLRAPKKFPGIAAGDEAGVLMGAQNARIREAEDFLRTTLKGDPMVTDLKPTFTEYNLLFPRPTPVEPSPVTASSAEPPLSTPGRLIGEVTLEVTLRRPTGKALKRWKPVAHAAAAAGGLVDAVDWNRAVLKHPGDVEKVYGLGTAEAMVKKTVTSLYAEAKAPVYEQHINLVAACMAKSGKLRPFTSAALNQSLGAARRRTEKHRAETAPMRRAHYGGAFSTFQQAALRGGTETLASAVSLSAFGRNVPLGTGGKFDLLLDLTRFPPATVIPERTWLCVEMPDAFRETEAARASGEEKRLAGSGNRKNASGTEKALHAVTAVHVSVVHHSVAGRASPAAFFTAVCVCGKELPEWIGAEHTLFPRWKARTLTHDGIRDARYFILRLGDSGVQHPPEGEGHLSAERLRDGGESDGC